MAEPGHAEACPSGGTRFRASTLPPAANGLDSGDALVAGGSPANLAVKGFRPAQFKSLPPGMSAAELA